MKRYQYGLVLLLAAILLAMTGADALSLLTGMMQKPTPKVIYIYKTTLGEIEFWRSMTDGIEAGAEEFGLDYSILGPREESDVEGNILALQRAIALQPDAIVLAAADYRRLAPMAQKAVDAGILLLTIDSDVEGDLSRCFISANNYQMGLKMGEELLGRMGGKGKIGVVGHYEDTFTAIERIRGLADAVYNVPGNQLLPPAYCNNQVQKAREETRRMLEEHPDLLGLVATNELAAVGVAEAIKEQELQEQVALVTCDHASRQIAFLEQGVIDATLVQRPFNMGYFSIQIIHTLLENPDSAEIPAFYDTGFEVIDRSNYFTPENQKLLFPAPEQ